MKNDLQVRYRTAIIARSEAHQFVDEDFAAIGKALNTFEGLSRIGAWRQLVDRFGEEEVYRRLTLAPPNFDAIDDLGSDSPFLQAFVGNRYARNPAVREAVLRRAGGRCELCGEPGFVKSDGTRYLETHHIIRLADDGEDRISNVIALCPGHHREAHCGERSAYLEGEMIAYCIRVAADSAR